MISEIQAEPAGIQAYQPYQPSYDMAMEQYDDYGPMDAMQGAPMMDDQSAISDSLMNPVDSVDGIQFDNFGADAPFGGGPDLGSWDGPGDGGMGMSVPMMGDGGGMGMDMGGERYEDNGFDLPM